MARSISAWRLCDPLAMATKQSPAAIQYGFEDAKHDILLLAALNAELVEALRACNRSDLSIVSNALAKAPGAAS